MALTTEERNELIIANQNVHHNLIGTCWKYTYKNGKGYVIYDFESAVTLTWNSYNSENIKEKTYIYAYTFDGTELKITWNPKNQKSGFDIYEVTPAQIIGKTKKIIIEKMG